MTLGRRPTGRRGRDGLPAWLIFLVGIALVFVVIVPNARVRAAPSDSGTIITSFFMNDPVCVEGRVAPDSQWYIIDWKPETRRVDIAYMHESVIEAKNPTPTPTRSPTTPPSVTSAPTLTPSRTPKVTATETPEETVTDVPNPTIPPIPEKTATS
jgi:hypothetical protein